MRTWLPTLLLCVFIGCKTGSKNLEEEIAANGPIRLHPHNSHYFLYHGKTLVLISSAEHYGAVINSDFDFQKYLGTLASEGMNYTRIFAGSYYEISGQSFGIKHNTLAPEPGGFLAPWPKDSTTGNHSKYDLSQWNPDYFKRIRDFLSIAAKYNIIVEVTLFSSIYNDEHWNINPQNPDNNLNIHHALQREDAQTLKNGDLLKFQEAYVRKMVNELKDFDNFFFEIQNEPWADRPVAVYNIVNKEDLQKEDWTYKADFGDEASLQWQEKVAGWISGEESKLDVRHLIAQNFTNFRAPVPEVDSLVSIINFHYAWPEAVTWNYHYDKVIGFDESGFAGRNDQVYRRQAWQFMLSGGGIFNNLDYSFYVGKEDGMGENEAPGGGSRALRAQLKILHDFLEDFQLEKLRPSEHMIKHSPGLIPYILSDGKKTFAIYLRAVGTSITKLALNVEKGIYSVQMLDPLTGKYTEPLDIQTDESGILHLDIDIPDGELAIKIREKS